jgi:hypothetical protein
VSRAPVALLGLGLALAGCAAGGSSTTYPWGAAMTPRERTAHAVFEQCRTAGGPPTPGFSAAEQPDGRVMATIYGPVPQRKAIAACMKTRGFVSDPGDGTQDSEKQ